MSGINCAEGCKEWYTNWVKDNSPYRAVTFKISNDYKNIVIDDEEYKEGDEKGVAKFQIKRESKHDEAECAKLIKTLVARLKEDETHWPRWIFVKLDFNTDDNRQAQKLVRINWVPDQSKIKAKMVFSASDNSLKGQLDTALPAIQCDDAEDVMNVPAKVKNAV